MVQISMFVEETTRERFKMLAEQRKEELQEIHTRAGYQELMRQALRQYLYKHTTSEA